MLVFGPIVGKTLGIFFNNEPAWTASSIGQDGVGAGNSAVADPLFVAIDLVAGDVFELYTHAPSEGMRGINVNYPGLPKDVHVGAIVLLDSGLIRMEVIQIDGQLPVIYSPLSMSAGWEQLPRAYDMGYADTDALKLGVNVFMYAVSH